MKIANQHGYKICESTDHDNKRVASKYPKDKVPLELFFKYVDDSNSQILKTCIDCRNYRLNNKKKSKAEKINLNPCDVSSETETMICNSNNHDKHCVSSKYPKNNVPKDSFRKYPGNLNSILYRNCLDCRIFSSSTNRKRLDKIKKEKAEKEAVVETSIPCEESNLDSEEDTELSEYPQEEGFLPCLADTHTYKHTKFHKEKVPSEMFLKDPTDPESGYLKTCLGCRTLSQKRRKDRSTVLLDTREVVLNSNQDKETLLMPCLHNCHGSNSEYDKMQVPYYLFLEDPDDGESDIKRNCLDCRNYDSARYFRSRKEKEEMANQQGKFLCTRDHIVDKLATNKDGSMSSSCEECKIKNKEYNSKSKKITNSIKKDFIKNHNCSCQKCKSIYLIPKGSEKYCRELKTYERNEERFLEFDGKEYLVKDFLISHESLLELRIIEFDHLTEKEQRERGILGPNDKYIPKIDGVGRMGSEKKIRKEAKKCQHLCARCHLEETISRYANRGIMTPSQKEKIDYVNNLKRCGCETCKYKNEKLLSFFEMDHLDPKNKINKIGNMVWSAQYTLLDVIEECEKCRVLCRHCHTIHTDYQIKTGIL